MWQKLVITATKMQGSTPLPLLQMWHFHQIVMHVIQLLYLELEVLTKWKEIQCRYMAAHGHIQFSNNQNGLNTLYRTHKTQHLRSSTKETVARKKPFIKMKTWTPPSSNGGNNLLDAGHVVLQNQETLGKLHQLCHQVRWIVLSYVPWSCAMDFHCSCCPSQAANSLSLFFKSTYKLSQNVDNLKMLSCS